VQSAGIAARQRQHLPIPRGANRRHTGIRREGAPGMEIAMLSSLFTNSALPVLERVVNFTEARHGVLAGNVANLDTPGYRTRDLSPALFEERLKEAVETARRPTPKYPTYSRQNESAAGRRTGGEYDAFRRVDESMKSILYHDDSDVSLERQVNEIVKNQQQHNLAIHIMSAQFRLLRAAITERVA
jgi:flagellar basal-body rod protein FlgB